MNKDYLTDVYQDFFGTPLTSSEKEEVEEEFNEEEIDNLNITDESKETIKKIFIYIKKYHEEKNIPYLNFNFIIQSNNKEIIKNVRELLKRIIVKYKYVTSNNSLDLSFYEMDNMEELKDSLNKNNIIVLKDIKGLELKDSSTNKKIFHLINENISLEKVFMLEGNKDEINYFFEFDNSLKEAYFPFIIEEKVKDIQDVYQEVLEIVDKDKKLSEDFSVKILDYITNTYNKSELSYPVYRDNLCREILLHNEVPTINEKKSMEEIFASLNELVGLEKVKTTLHELVDYMTLKDKSKDLKLNNVNLHMVFLGNPGTGKTTVARLISDILYNLGYIKQNKLIEVTSKDLVAEYVGQTAPKTMSVIERAMGGILFIDEAYALANKDGKNTYNAESIATLIKAMEDYRDNLVVIFAGYTKEMQDFLDSNSGIVSRIGYTFEFDDYTEDELVEIFTGMMKKAGFEVEEEALLYLRNIIRKNKDMKNFGNARFIRNIYEKTIIKHAFNTKDKKQKKILRTITREDISVDNLNIVV